jgi:hypothetical protein
MPSLSTSLMKAHTTAYQGGTGVLSMRMSQAIPARNQCAWRGANRYTRTIGPGNYYSARKFVQQSMSVNGMRLQRPVSVICASSRNCIGLPPATRASWSMARVSRFRCTSCRRKWRRAFRRLMSRTSQSTARRACAISTSSGTRPKRSTNSVNISSSGTQRGRP